MGDLQSYVLQIDDRFRTLVPPLSADEYHQLEQNIVKEGCREPICIWNGFIIDGHNRYDICSKNGIPFEIRSIDLYSYEAVVAWICANQLGRRNISEETRKYLIGKRYDAEKIIGVTNPAGINQYTKKADGFTMCTQPLSNINSEKTAERLSKEYHISRSAVHKYSTYSQALDTLAQKEPEIVPRILSGQLKISQANVVELSTLPKADVQRLSQRLSSDNEYSVRKQVRENKFPGQTTQPPTPSTQILSGQVKNMPAYDPDAELISLSLTIPSWVSSINRTRSMADLSLVSNNARVKLEMKLINLKDTVEDMLIVIREDNNNG